MAPRRGGGGGGAGGASGCSSRAFDGTITDPQDFAAWVLALVLNLVALVYAFRVRSRHPSAKAILGPIYYTALCFSIIAYILAVSITLLAECKQENAPYDSIGGTGIAHTVFDFLANFFLLVCVFWTVNRAVAHGVGRSLTFVNMISAAVLSFMGALTVAVMGLYCYYNWSTWHGTYWDDEVEKISIVMVKLALAKSVLFLVVALTGGCLSIRYATSTRSQGRKGLIGLLIGLTFCMLLWNVFTVAYYAMVISSWNDWTITPPPEYFDAAEWIMDISQAACYILLIFIAKNRALDPNAQSHVQSKFDANTNYQAQTYAQVPQQQYYTAGPIQGGHYPAEVR